GSTKNRIPSCARPAPPTARRPVPSPPDGQGKIVENQSGKELWIEIRRLMRHCVARPGDLHNQIRSRRIQNASQVADSVERRLHRFHRVPRVGNVPPVLLELPRHLETLLQHDPMEYRCTEQLPGVGCLLVDDVEELAAVARPQGPALPAGQKGHACLVSCYGRGRFFRRPSWLRSFEGCDVEVAAQAFFYPGTV